jgi:hypothetical protein
MNGRVYDPILGRFLGPDPIVQNPGNTQGYNRYGYCLNNPLRYFDPTGYTWWSHFWGWADETGSKVVATTGKILAWSFTFAPSVIDAIHNGDWSRLDPFKKGTISNNCYQITSGLFSGSFKQAVSRFTWELPQTILGYGYSMASNYFGTVQSVNFYDGATVVQNYKDHVWLGSGSDLGITLGSFINGNNEIEADPNTRLFQHEYGHYIQSQTSGWFYLSKYAIPSALSKYPYNQHPVEQDANIRAFTYFNKHIDGYSGWVFTGLNGNPINGYDPWLPYNDPTNQAALRDGRLRLAWYDYLLGPNIILSGLLNTLILNNQY